MTAQPDTAASPESVASVFGRRHEEAFVEGDCWHLALELRRLTGRPVVFLNPWGHDDPEYWEHAGLLLPDGRVLDVLGVHDEQVWIGRWRWKPELGHEPLVIRASTDEQVAALTDDVERQFPWSRVRAVARYLVDRYVTTPA